MAAEGMLTEEGYAFNLVADSDPIEERLMRRVYGQGSYLQQIVFKDLVLGDRDANDFGIASEVSLAHFFVVDDLSSRVSVGLSDPDDVGVWRLVVSTMSEGGRQLALVPKGGENVSIGLLYNQDSSTVTAFYDADVFDAVPPIDLTLPVDAGPAQESETRLYISAVGLNTSGIVHSWSLSPNSDVSGDFNGNGILDAADIDQLSEQVRAATNDPLYDLNADALVNDLDRQVWVHDLKQTYFGDADLNGSFDSTDLVQVLASGEYEDGVDLKSAWRTGDWDGDGDFTSGDLVVALADGGYEAGPRAAVVPEPASAMLAMASAALVAICRRRHSKTHRA
jgi:hypothetical protein